MVRRKFRRCVGCEEQVPVEEAIVVQGLGSVCQWCNEVIEIVWEVELERVREATAAVRAFVEDLQAGRI